MDAPSSHTTAHRSQPPGFTRSQYLNSGGQSAACTQINLHLAARDQRLALEKRQGEELNTLARKHCFELNELRQRHIRQNIEFHKLYVPLPAQARQVSNPRHNAMANHNAKERRIPNTFNEHRINTDIPTAQLFDAQNRPIILHSRSSHHDERQERVQPSDQFKPAINAPGYNRPQVYIQDALTNRENPNFLRQNHTDPHIPSTTQSFPDSRSVSPKIHTRESNQTLPAIPITNTSIDSNQDPDPALNSRPRVCVVDLLDSSDSESDTTRFHRSITHQGPPESYSTSITTEQLTNGLESDNDRPPTNLTSPTHRQRTHNSESENKNTSAAHPTSSTRSAHLQTWMDRIAATNKRLEALQQKIGPYTRAPLPQHATDRDLRSQLLRAAGAGAGTGNRTIHADVESQGLTHEDEIVVASEYALPLRKRMRFK